MWNKLIRRTTVGLCVSFVVTAFGVPCVAQYGENAPRNNCPCVPARQYWGYYQTRWHRWPCDTQTAETQTQQTPAGEEISPSQIDLPNPKTEAEIKPTSPTQPAQSEPTPKTAPETAPTTPPQTAPSNPLLESMPEQAPEKKESAAEPSATEPPKEPEAPKELPLAPPNSGEPTPNESPSPLPESNGSKPKESSKESPMQEPDSGRQLVPGNSGASNMSPGLRLRCCENRTFGLHDPDADPPPVMPVDSRAFVPERAPSFCVSDSSHSTVQPCAAKEEPKLIAPSSDVHPLVATAPELHAVQPSGSNPLRIGGPQPATKWTAPEQKTIDAVRPVSDDSSHVAARANPLR